MQIKFLKFKREEHYKKKKEDVQSTMHLYWEVAVCFMGVVTLLALLLGYFLFMSINQEPAAQSANSNSSHDTIKKDRLDKVLQYFSTKAQNSIQILNSPAPVTDPSV